MIDLELTEEHKALQTTVREFVAGEVAPYIKEWDEKAHFERSIFEKMAELGLLGVCVPEQYGGAGFDYVSFSGDAILDDAASTRPPARAPDRPSSRR